MSEDRGVAADDGPGSRGPSDSVEPFVSAEPSDRSDLAEVLHGLAPFAAAPQTIDGLAGSARIARFDAGDLVLDAFHQPSVEVFVVLSGRVDVWNDASRISAAADERLGRGGVFGFSAMLTERSVGPRVVALDPVRVAALPAAEVGPVFSSPAGAKFLATQLCPPARPAAAVSYSLVDDLIDTVPLIADPDQTVAELARAMTDRQLGYAVLPLGTDQAGPVYALVTDAVLRERVLVGGLPGAAPVRELTDRPAATVRLGDSAAEAQIAMVEQDADFLVVLDPAGAVRGVIAPRDFAVSPTTAGASLLERLRRAGDTAELARRSRRIPATLSELLGRGLSSGRVVAVHSTLIDTVVRRAIVLIFADRPELPTDAFTWLALGSNGRREALFTSDVDSAVAFDDSVPPSRQEDYRAAFGELGEVLSRSGLHTDNHGAIAHRVPFSRTNADWRAAARQWWRSPGKDQGAIMTSLLVDARPIYGDPELPAASQVFSEVRRHPGTMRLLLEESLSQRARMPSVWEVLTRRGGTFDVKAHAVRPIVNLARWAALSVDSVALGTVDRLRAAAGSTMLPDDRAEELVESFEVLQRIRLRYQLLAQQRGQRPSDELALDRLSAIDRGMVTQAVRTIAAVQRRMDNVAVVVPPSGWADPAPS